MRNIWLTKKFQLKPEIGQTQPTYKMPKPAGLSFNRYAAIAGRILRKALKEDKRVAAERLDTFELRRTKWENGRQSEPEALQVSLKK